MTPPSASGEKATGFTFSTATFASRRLGNSLAPVSTSFSFTLTYNDGARFFLDPHVVIKADYQTFRDNKDFTRFDLGLGLAF